MKVHGRGLWNRVTGRSTKTTLDQLTTAVDDLRKRLGRQRRTVGRQEGRLDRLEASDQRRAEAEKERAAHLRMLRLDLERMSSQLGGLEVRFADAMDDRDIVQSADAAAPADDPAVAEVLSRLTEIRREHEQIRIRFRVIAAYEERIRRLEEAVHGEHVVLADGPQIEPVPPAADLSTTQDTSGP